MRYVDPTGHIAQILVGGAAGALIGGGLNLARQTIAIAEGAQDEFKWGQLGASILAGAVIGGTATVNPLLAAQMGAIASGAGLASGAREIEKGHEWTGAFDITTSVLGIAGSKKLAEYGGTREGVIAAEGRNAGSPELIPAVPPAGPKGNGPVIEMTRDSSGVWVAQDAALGGGSTPLTALQPSTPRLALPAPDMPQLPVVRPPLALPAAPGGQATAEGPSPTLPGGFSIIDWRNYPGGVPRPQGPFRLLEGAEYQAARRAANQANRAMHKDDPTLAGSQIHEVKPVKFGGSPTDPANKVALPPEQHRPATSWWNELMRALTEKR